MKKNQQSDTHASSSPGKSKSCAEINKRNRKRNISILKNNSSENANSAINTTLNNANNKSVNNIHNYDSDDTIETTDEELYELEPKDTRVKQTLQKIAKIRQLPDYERIEKILHMNDTLTYKKKRSLNSIGLMKSPTPFWNTYTYLLKEIENCIAKKYWSKLTTLLIYLSGAVKKCEPLLLKATIINFISNPTSQMYELLGEFLKECYSCRTEEDIEKLLTRFFHIKPKINTLI